MVALDESPQSGRRRRPEHQARKLRRRWSVCRLLQGTLDAGSRHRDFCLCWRGTPRLRETRRGELDAGQASNPPRTALAEGAASLTHSGGGELNAHPVIADLRWHPDGLDVVLSSPVAQRLSVHLRWPGRTATQVSPTMAVEVELRPDAPFLEQTFATLAYFDGAVLCRTAAAPALFSVGLRDDACPSISTRTRACSTCSRCAGHWNRLRRNWPPC